MNKANRKEGQPSDKSSWCKEDIEAIHKVLLVRAERPDLTYDYWIWITVKRNAVVITNSWWDIFKKAVLQAERLRIVLIIFLPGTSCTEINKRIGRKEQLYVEILTVQEIIKSYFKLVNEVKQFKVTYVESWDWLKKETDSNW